VSAMTSYSAAWVPKHDDTDWEDAAALAIAWVTAQGREQGRTPLLVTNGQGAESSVPALVTFGSRYGRTTPRSARVDGNRPVLAYVPDTRTLDFAAGKAHGSSLCVVEGFGLELAGWARDSGAVDLTGRSSAPQALDPRLTEALDRLEFHGNNGWTRGFGQDQARRILADLHSARLLDRSVIVGAMLARGSSTKAVQRLEQLIDGAGT